MMAYILVPAAFLVLLVVQDLLADILFLGQCPCELSLVLVIYLGFRMPYLRGAIWVTLLGFLMDAVNGRVTGLYMFIYLFLFVCSRLVAERLYGESELFIAGMVFMGMFFETFVCLLFTGSLAGQVSVTSYVSLLLPQLALLTVSAPLFFHGVDKLGWCRRDDERSVERP